LFVYLKNMPQTATERLFFALWPPDTVRQAIQQYGLQMAQIVQGQPTRPENLHITLAFVGEVDKSTKQAMQQVAATLHGEAFSLSLDEIGYWAKPQILWLGARQLPAALLKWVTQLSADLQTCGYRPETRPYAAHVTLLRKAKLSGTLPAITPLTWVVQDFHLVKSVMTRTGVYYQVLEHWPLT